MAAVEVVLEETVVIAAAAGLHVGRIRRMDALSSRCLDATSVVVIPDAARDARFAGSRLVHTPKGVRFYAAVPLTAPEGAVLGVLSVWDHAPGELTPSQRESLESLGRMTMAQLNLWRRQRQLERLEAQHARVEAALRQAEAKFRGIFEHTVVGIYQTTADGHYISANPMLAKIYGYSSPEELMAAVNDIKTELYVEPDARDRFIAALQKEDIITNFEARIRRKDGTIIWIAENARVVRDEHGDVAYYEGTVQDITARKLAEEQLRTSEMLYHSLVEQLPQNIFRKDTNERFIFANSRFCETLERPLDQILGRTDFDLFPPALARKYQADDQRVMAEGRTLRATEKNVTPDGTVHWVEVIKTPLRDASGAIVGIQGIYWDVTERKRLQDALAYERDLLQALLDHSPDIIYFKDPQSRFVMAGRALARRFHLTDPEELVGRTVADVIDPEVAKVIHEEEQNLLRTGEAIVNKVEELVDHLGRASWVSVTKVPIYNRAGETLGIVGVARDITPLIQAEQALREAEEKYRTIFENSVEGIYQTTPDGRFLRVNPALARLCGYDSPEDLIRNLTDIRTQVYVDPNRRDEFVRLLLEKGSITGFESEIYRRDGSTIWISESARIVRDREGGVAFFEGSLEDISARKQIEAEREKARQAALESARMKSEFVATVSHEIRTPLNAILPNTERLLETDLEPHQRYLAESIDHGARLLLQIVNDILDLSKIGAGAVRLESIEFDLHEVVERAVAFFASRAAARHLELISDIDPAVPRRFRGDPSRLGQVLNNLLGNAIKFTETGEVVLTVDVPPRDSRSPGPGGEAESGAAPPPPSETAVVLRFQIRDTGIGIAPEARETIFHAFAQADGSMSRRYGGTGLGLAITRGLLQVMGGTIDFTSEVGRGTTFTVEIPFEPIPDAEAPRPAPRVLAGLNVLIIDDNATLRDVLERAVRSLGAASVRATDSIAAAVELAEERTPAELRSAGQSSFPCDIILYDWNLPGTTGLQVARRIRASGFSTARLVALTTPGTLADVRSLEAAGVFGTLVKPLRQSRLASDLAAILAGQSRAPVPPPRPDSTGRPGAGLSVLVVEDQPLNQRVACDLLVRLGARAHAVSSGPQALEALGRGHFDLVLMDCQMPEMDGYETTRRIRAAEQERPGAPRIPVVALSANAYADDRARAIDAGMDDYLTKPLIQSDLVRVLRSISHHGDPEPVESVQPPPAAAVPPTPGRAPSGDLPVIDFGPLRALSSPEDPGAAAGFVKEFLNEAPERIARLKAALEQADARRLRAEAHAFKGGASYMGARRLVDACAQLEHAVQTSNLQSAAACVAAVEKELDAARAVLLEYIETQSSPA